MIRNSVINKVPLPDSIKNAPFIFDGLELYYCAFLDLTTCRPHGAGGEGPISWLSIYEYGVVNEFDESQMDDLMFFIPRMDNEYLKFKADKIRKEIGKTTGSKKR